MHDTLDIFSSCSLPLPFFPQSTIHQIMRLFLALLFALPLFADKATCKQKCQDELYESCYDYIEDDSETDGMPCDNVDAVCETKCDDDPE
jgi:hypothetical protein